MKTRILLTEFIDELLYKIVIEHRHISDAVDMPDSWFRVMRFLAKHESASMSTLASFLHVSTPRATKVADALVEAGYAKRMAGKDRRTVELTLTAKGSQIIKDTTLLHQHMSEHILSALDNNEREQFYRLLQKCVPAAMNTNLTDSPERCQLMHKTTQSHNAEYKSL